MGEAQSSFHREAGVGVWTLLTRPCPVLGRLRSAQEELEMQARTDHKALLRHKEGPAFTWPLMEIVKLTHAQPFQPSKTTVLIFQTMDWSLERMEAKLLVMSL